MPQKYRFVPEIFFNPRPDPCFQDLHKSSLSLKPLVRNGDSFSAETIAKQILCGNVVIHVLHMPVHTPERGI
jgi:hypothetical protein